MTAEIRSAIDFYEQHPISAAIILAKLNSSRGHLSGLTPEELFPHDQDHYGGLAANDALAKRVRIGRGTRVADFCAGLGGPARGLAHTYGAEVTGIELTPARVAGANDLTHRVGLDAHVHVIEGNVMAVPLPERQHGRGHQPGGLSARAEPWPRAGRGVPHPAHGRAPCLHQLGGGAALVGGGYRVDVAGHGGGAALQLPGATHPP